jgi:hypothetical protein
LAKAIFYLPRQEKVFTSPEKKEALRYGITAFLASIGILIK